MTQNFVEVKLINQRLEQNDKLVHVLCYIIQNCLLSQFEIVGFSAVMLVKRSWGSLACIRGFFTFNIITGVRHSEKI